MSVEFVHASDIEIGRRQREEFKQTSLEELRDSILDVGLIHAPVVSNDMQLAAGERRLRALALTEGKPYRYGDAELCYPEVPVHMVPVADPRTLAKIELDENLRRENLTAMEEARAIATLHGLATEVHPGQTMKDTSEDLAKLEGHEPRKSDEVRVANSILVEQFKDDPEVQKAAKVSLNRAAKVARKKMEIQLSRVLGGTEFLQEDEFFEVRCGDAKGILQEYQSNPFDILLFDPPYGVGADSFGEQAMDLGHQYDDDWLTARDLVESIISAPIYKDQAHALMFCSYDKFQIWKEIYHDNNWRPWPRPLIWSKGQQAHAPRPGFGPRYSYECVLFAARGDRQVRETINDVIHCPPPKDKIHAAEKPADLLAELIRFVASPGDRLVDPTCGSGPIFTAARGKELFVTGIELSADYAAIAQGRAKER